MVVDGFMGRPLDGGPYPYLWLDALTQKVREDGRIVNVSVVVATAVNGEGKREIIGMDVGTSEDGAFWLAFLRSLSASGVTREWPRRRQLRDFRSLRRCLGCRTIGSLGQKAETRRDTWTF